MLWLGSCLIRQSWLLRRDILKLLWLGSCLIGQSWLLTLLYRVILRLLWLGNSMIGLVGYRRKRIVLTTILNWEESWQGRSSWV